MGNRKAIAVVDGNFKTATAFRDRQYELQTRISAPASHEITRNEIVDALACDGIDPEDDAC